MVKPGSASRTDAAASHNTVFIDTSLDTHLAMVVLDGDTVSDLKEKIEKEHPLCFPHVGNIKIHALKVKRKGYFYHLSESMYLKSAFVGVNKSWFLFIDASSIGDHSTDPHTGNLSTYFEMANNTKIDGINLARNSQPEQIPNHDAPLLREHAAQQYVNEKAPSDIHFGLCQSTKNDLIIKEAEGTHSVENCSKVHLERVTGCEGDNESLEPLPAVKVNHKSKKRKANLMNEHALEIENYSIDGNGQNPFQHDIGSCEKLRDCAGKEDPDLQMMESKSYANEPGRSSSSNACNESEYRLKGKFNLSEETELPGELDRVKDCLEGNRDLVSDSNKVTSKPDVTSDYFTENKQTAKVVLDGLSAETDVHLLETGSNGAKRKKRKRKAQLSDYPNQAVCLISSRAGAQNDESRESDVTTAPSHDVEDASIPKLLGISVREKHNDSNHKTAENFASSPVSGSDVNMYNTDIDGVHSMGDASDKAVLGVIRATDSKGPVFISNDYTNLPKSISTSEDANYIQSNLLACKTGQTVAIPEERDSMQNADTKATMVKNCHSSSWAGADSNSKVTQISELLHLKGTTKTTKCSKKKKTRRSKDSAEGRQINLVTTGVRDYARDIPLTEFRSIDGDKFSSEAEIGESNISPVKGEDTVNASILPTDRNIDIDKTSRSVEPLVQINKTEAGTENMDEQVRKKFKKRPVNLTKSMSDLQAKNMSNEDSSPSKRSNRGRKSVSKLAKKAKLPKEKFMNEIEEGNLDSMRPSEVESSPPSIPTKSWIAGSPLIPSHASEGNHEERPLEANMYSNTSKDGTANNIDDNVEVSCESNKVDIEERAGELQHESIEVHIDKLSREKSANTLLKVKRKKKDLRACSSEISLNLQHVRKSDENAETGRHCQTSISSSLKEHEVEKISRDGGKSLPSGEREQNMSDDKTRVRANAVDISGNSAGKNSEAFAVPRIRSNLKNSKIMVHQDQKHMGRQSSMVGHPMGGRKSSRNGNRDVTRSEQKNLLASAGVIFKDASSDSSEDEGGIGDSDASTRSPDNSLSSDFTDGESNANMNSSKNGSIDWGRKNIRGRSARKMGSSSPENINLGTILRSSSRYKKAKLTAAQSQLEDTESQPVDFVPDSQANL